MMTAAAWGVRWCARPAAWSGPESNRCWSLVWWRRPARIRRFRHRRYRPYCRRTRPWWEPQRLPRPRARWFGDYCGQRRRPRQKGASPPRLRQRSQPVVQPRLPRRTVPPARPAKRWDSTHPRRWHSAIDPACNDPCDPGPVQNGRQPMCRPVVRKDSRCPRPRAQVPPSSAWCRTQARRLRQKRARTPPTTNRWRRRIRHRQ